MDYKIKQEDLDKIYEKAHGVQKSNWIFIYESIDAIPNGDPYTGNPRFDSVKEVTNASCYRVKRFVRDYIEKSWNTLHPDQKQYLLFGELDEDFVRGLKQKSDKTSSGVAIQMKYLREMLQHIPEIADATKSENKKGKKAPQDAEAIFQQCTDTRMFGGICSEQENTAAWTGPIFVNSLNSSMNKVDLEPFQNTSILPSNIDKDAGSMGFRTQVPYALMQILGGINPLKAIKTHLTADDVKFFYYSMWHGANDCLTSSKNHVSALMVNINYSDINMHNSTTYIKDLIKINEKDNKSLRSFQELTWDFSALNSFISKDVVKNAEYFIDDMKEDFVKEFLKQTQSVSSKLTRMVF